MAKFTGPTYIKMMPYVLRALEELGGRAMNEEIDQRVIDLMGFSNEVVSFPHLGSTKSEVSYRLAWARTDLKKIGMVENPARSTWELTEKGRLALDGDPSEIIAQVNAIRSLEAAQRSLGADAGKESANPGFEYYSLDVPDADSDLNPSPDQPLFAYFVGASINGVDMTEGFLSEGIWQCGYEEKYADQINAIQQGTSIAIKAAYTRKYDLPFDNHEETVSVMKIKARGTVRYNPCDGKTLRVDWDKDYEPREWLFFTLRPAFNFIRRDLQDWKRGALIDFAFNDDVQDIEAFISDPLWVGRYDAVVEGEDAELSELEEAAIEAKPYGPKDFLHDVYMDETEYDRLVELLRRKGNVILQGAPGTGKTYAAKRLAWSLMGKKDDSRIEFVQFHQSTAYEDIIVGYRPTENGGFKLKNGTFTQLCQRAEASTEAYFFIIDEINRANVSKVMGEMLMTVEKKHRGETVGVRLQDGRNGFSVPGNIYIIGMMITADRSIATMDYALRRRFAYFEMRPAFQQDGFRKRLYELMPADFADALIASVRELNARIEEERGRGLCIGHSFFLDVPDNDGVMDVSAAQSWLGSIVDYEIAPLLEEYWFDAAPNIIASYVASLRELAGARK